MRLSSDLMVAQRSGIDRLFDDDLRSGLRALREDLHRHPELSLHEHATAARLIEALRSLVGDIEIHRVGETGIVARVPGASRGAPQVAIRGDIDALPIQEETGLEFSSVEPGVMHACGHDVHATWAVGAAALLVRVPAAGDVLIVLQPAEEIGEGARLILNSGLLADTQAIFGAHVDRRFAVGEVVADAGPVGAATDEFVIDLRGQGGHGARPHLGRDPIVAGSALVTALQTIVSRRVDPGQPAVATVGTFQAGTAQNIIPDTARLTGTLRSFSTEVRELLRAEVERITQGICAAHDVAATVVFRGGTPAVVNEARATEWARQAVAQTLGSENLRPMGGLNLGGEDFAYYLERMPGAFLRIGARETGGKVIGAHTPFFYAANEAVFLGAAVLAESARVAAGVLAGRPAAPLTR